MIAGNHLRLFIEGYLGHLAYNFIIHTEKTKNSLSVSYTLKSQKYENILDNIIATDCSETMKLQLKDWLVRLRDLGMKDSELESLLIELKSNYFELNMNGALIYYFKSPNVMQTIIAQVKRKTGLSTFNMDNKSAIDLILKQTYDQYLKKNNNYLDSYTGNNILAQIVNSIQNYYDEYNLLNTRLFNEIKCQDLVRVHEEDFNIDMIKNIKAASDVLYSIAGNLESSIIRYYQDKEILKFVEDLNKIGYKSGLSLTYNTRVDELKNPALMTRDNLKNKVRSSNTILNCLSECILVPTNDMFARKYRECAKLLISQYEQKGGGNNGELILTPENCRRLQSDIKEPKFVEVFKIIIRGIKSTVNFKEECDKARVDFKGLNDTRLLQNNLANFMDISDFIKFGEKTVSKVNYLDDGLNYGVDVALNVVDIKNVKGSFPISSSITRLKVDLKPLSVTMERKNIEYILPSVGKILNLNKIMNLISILNINEENKIISSNLGTFESYLDFCCAGKIALKHMIKYVALLVSIKYLITEKGKLRKHNRVYESAILTGKINKLNINELLEIGIEEIKTLKSTEKILEKFKNEIELLPSFPYSTYNNHLNKMTILFEYSNSYAYLIDVIKSNKEEEIFLENSKLLEAVKRVSITSRNELFSEYIISPDEREKDELFDFFSENLLIHTTEVREMITSFTEKVKYTYGIRSMGERDTEDNPHIREILQAKKQNQTNSILSKYGVTNITKMLPDHIRSLVKQSKDGFLTTHTGRFWTYTKDSTLYMVDNDGVLYRAYYNGIDYYVSTESGGFNFIRSSI